MVTGLERVLRSMTVLVFFENPVVLAAVGEMSASQRQNVYRTIRRTALIAQ